MALVQPRLQQAKIQLTSELSEEINCTSKYLCPREGREGQLKQLEPIWVYRCINDEDA